MGRVVHTEELIRRFKEQAAIKYPHITPANIEKICRAEFKMAKEVIESGSLEEIRLQYLFVLRVSPQRIMKQLAFMASYVPTSEHSISKHIHYSDMALNYVRKYLSKFKKTKKRDYESRIREYTGYTLGEISRGEYIGNGYSRNTN